MMNRLLRGISDFVTKLRQDAVLSNRKYQRMVERAIKHCPSTTSLSDDQLRSQSQLLRSRVSNEIQEAAAVEFIALAQEAAVRTIGLRPYDVQLLAAFALNDQKCVEMQTGEGKTLAAALVASLRAQVGRGCHILTFNDYLARRDALWMQPLYEFFGLSVGHIGEGMSSDERRAAYQCDVTYVTAKEAGFDFLRDEDCEALTDRVHREFYFAIVDEADSCLVDEARIPLVLATEHEVDGVDLYRLAELIKRLENVADFSVTSHGRNCSYTERGISRLEQSLDCGPLHSEANTQLLARLNVGLHAQSLLKLGRDYIVREDRIELIDEFTGRVADHRRWPGGIQAAVEAKEAVPIQPQGKILQSVTVQNFLKSYEGLSGMSGTALESAEEFKDFYDLKVVVVPPNRPCIRVEQADRVFETVEQKHAALVEEIQRAHTTQRPILVGTGSVEESQQLARSIQQADIACRVLNAANDFEEAQIVAEAGALGAVTISTNMAGRGTDIKLGGSAGRTRDAVVELGGLYVIGTNRHESRRIDHQLRGRAGRQGDPGESRFFVSLEDDLLTRFGVDELIENTIVGTEGEIVSSDTKLRIAHLQRVIEGESFEIRRTLKKYALVPEKQREEISRYRKQFLDPSSFQSVLQRNDPQGYTALIETWGARHLHVVERQVALRVIAWCWSGHLERSTEIRESIHLYSYGGFNPMDEFHRQLHHAFDSLIHRIESMIVETMQSITITEQGADFAERGLERPSSTWTHTIDDNPTGDVVERLNRAIRRLVKHWS